MSTLERHCQLLLRAYPAAYREASGEEIIGTLLEATPPGRSWPSPRDIRCLIAGGLRARAAQPRQLTTAANLRLAVLTGVAAYLAFGASSVLATDVPPGVMPGRLYAPSDWPLFTSLVLPLIPMALVWVSGRRVVVLAGALPAFAATCYAGPWWHYIAGSAVVRLVCLAALVALAGRANRPRWRWLWLVGPLAVAPMLAVAPVLAGVAWVASGVVLAALLLALSVLTIACIVIDARPAVVVAVFLMAIQLSLTIDTLATGGGLQLATLFTMVVPVTLVVAVWRLRRQSAHPGRPTQA